MHSDNCISFKYSIKCRIYVMNMDVTNITRNATLILYE